MWYKKAVNLERIWISMRWKKHKSYVNTRGNLRLMQTDIRGERNFISPTIKLFNDFRFRISKRTNSNLSISEERSSESSKVDLRLSVSCNKLIIKNGWREKEIPFGKKETDIKSEAGIKVMRRN